MKKNTALVLALCAALTVSLTGCGNGNKAKETTAAAAETAAAASTEAAGEETTAAPGETTAAAAAEADVDLTVLSSTMVYSEVYNMMVTPEDYIGKTVRMNGNFNRFQDSDTKNWYFTCVIQDATMCCAQGMEFILNDSYSFPADYPEVDSEITVQGVFDTYEENDYVYCTLRDAVLL